MRVLRVSAVLVLALACANPTESTPTLSVRSTATAIELTNHASVATYYFAIEQGAAAYTEWVPCIAGCTAVSAGASVVIADTAIEGYFPGAKHAIVYWWHAVPGPADGSVPDSVRAIVVDL